MGIVSQRDIALTGIPRGGTTLACRLLGEGPDCVALFEPMPVLSLPLSRALAVQDIALYFCDVRQRALEHGRVPSKHSDGVIPDNPFGAREERSGVRPQQTDLGEIAVGKPLSPEFRLVIKHNAAFTSLLPELAERFTVVGVLRNPLAVLASWRSLDLPVSRGRLPAGERWDPVLATALDAQPDLLRRQIMLLEWFFARLQSMVAPTRLVRYEDTVASHGEALLHAAGRTPAAGAGVALRNRNVNAQYDAGEVTMLVEMLREHAHACWSSYSVAEVETLAARMTTGDRGDD